MYEAALHLVSDHVPALVGLGVLLAYSCKYPAKQTWIRALELFDKALVHVPFDSTSRSLQEYEDNCFCWAMLLHAQNVDVRLVKTSNPLSNTFNTGTW